MAKRGTNSPVARAAARILNNPNSSPRARRVAGSALTQSKAPKERTSAGVASMAAEIMQDDRFSKDAKKVAASVLAQRKK